MRWVLEIRPEVLKDVSAAADWYDSREFGLGARFDSEIQKVIESLTRNPFLNSRRSIEHDIRWRYTTKFPYRVIYKVDADREVVLVIAVTHAARNTEDWSRRIK